MVSRRLDPGCWQGRPVFVTGHTGFKGSWLALWLARLGARVGAVALPPATTPSLFELARVRAQVAVHHEGDIRCQETIRAAMAALRPEVVFHLAAQPLVRQSYRDPVETWSTNVIGTVNLLEAVRHCPSVKAIVVVTTDKCYENRESAQAYRESDSLGGYDPYSASKAAAELVVQSYRRSFLAEHGVLLASARAGNVIGGGDFSADRLIPDAARAVAAGQILSVRNPLATRPWQHVLESLNGYLRLAESLLAGDAACARAFNFGPHAVDNLSVADVLARLRADWPELRWQAEAASRSPHEAQLLHLDSGLAASMLGWQPVWTLARGLEKTAEWYRAAAQGNPRMAELTLAQIAQFEDSMHE